MELLKSSKLWLKNIDFQPDRLTQHNTIIMKYLPIINFLIIHYSFLSFSVFGQFPTNQRDFSSGTFGQNNPSTNQQDQTVEIDTFGVFYLYSNNPTQEYAFDDSTLTNFFQYDPILQQGLHYAHLGNLGSAHRPLVFQPEWRRGLNIGLNQYDLYQFRAKDVKFYRLEKAYTQVYYSQGANQADGYFKGTFSRNFANGLNFSMDYKRLSQLGQSSQYPHQNGRNTGFNTGFWYHSKNNKYDAYFSYVSNSIEQEDNGGIEVEPTTTSEFSSPSSAQVFLSRETARTRYANQSFTYTHYYQLGGGSDSTGMSKRSFTLAHELAYTNAQYKFSDTNPDSTYYLHFQTNDIGLRHFIRNRKLSNTFKISTFRLRTDDNKAKKQRDLIETGLIYDINFLNQEPIDSIVNNLFLTGKINFNPNSDLRIHTYAHLGILANAGDYRLSGEFYFNLKNLGSLKAEFTNQAYTPTLIQEGFYISQQEFWKQDFKKTISTSLAGTLTIPRLRTEVSGQYHLLNNYIYFDSLSLPQQLTSPVNVLQLIVNQNFVFFNIHLDNHLVLQQTTGEVLRLPSFYSTHRLYFGGLLFKKALEAQIGAELRMNSSFFADYYQPLTGQFHLQNRQEVQFYPALAAFASLKVDKFRFFAKAENLTDLFTNKLFYQTAFYAEPIFFIRFGLSWRFIN